GGGGSVCRSRRRRGAVRVFVAPPPRCPPSFPPPPARPPLDRSWRAYYLAVITDAMVGARQALFTVVFLVHQAWISADAIGRTLWRLLVSRRRLLEWRTASQVERSRAGSAPDLWRAVWPTLLYSAARYAALVVPPPPPPPPARRPP